MAYTWKAVLDVARAGLETGINRSGWDAVDRIDVSADGMDADVHFKDAYAGWLSVVGANVILPEHYMSDIPFPKWSESYPASARLVDAVTLGPFKYAVVTRRHDQPRPGRQLGRPGRGLRWQGVPRRHHLQVLQPTTRKARSQPFCSGEIDLAQGLTQGVDDAAITEVDPAIGRVISEPPEWRYEHLDFNQAGLGQGRGHPALRDVVVRRAIAQAIDKKAMWEAVFPGAAHPNNNPCTVATPTNYWRLPDAQCLPFDVNAANAALDYGRLRERRRRHPRGSAERHAARLRALHDDRQFSRARIRAHRKVARGHRDQAQPELSSTATSILFANWSDVPRPTTKCNLARGNYDTAEFLYALAIDPL